jgi:hypothetical protein
MGNEVDNCIEAVVRRADLAQLRYSLMYSLMYSS